MIKKNVLSKIRDQKMDRKDFLKYSGLVLVSVVGLKGIVTLLTQPESKTVVVQDSKSGFGSGKYGA